MCALQERAGDAHQRMEQAEQALREAVEESEFATQVHDLDEGLDKVSVRKRAEVISGAHAPLPSC